jgi:hypothetical protein
MVGEDVRARHVQHSRTVYWTAPKWARTCAGALVSRLHRTLYASPLLGSRTIRDG